MTPVRRSRLAGLVAAALAAAAGLVGLSSAPAAAAVCSTSGISAVVDAKGAGGGLKSLCDPIAGARSAPAVFQDVKVSVERNRDGSVCKVGGLPENANCQGLGTQYWALFWSNGKSGTWVYSQQGDGSLIVPKNGSVAWAWQSSSARREPGTAPPVLTSTPKPTPKPKPKPTPKPKPKPTPKPTSTPKPTRAPTVSKPTKTASAATSAAATAKASARASARAGAKSSGAASPSASGGESPSASASAEPSASDATSDDASSGVTSTENVNSAFTPDDEHSGLPPWVPVGVIVVLAGAAGGSVWWRRRSGAA